jgi:hypothetical protein
MAMIGQSVWHKDDIAQIGATLITIAPSWDFAAGVAALCNAIGASVYLPERSEPVAVAAVIDGANSREMPQMVLREVTR